MYACVLEQKEHDGVHDKYANAHFCIFRFNEFEFVTISDIMILFSYLTTECEK